MAMSRGWRGVEGGEEPHCDPRSGMAASSPSTAYLAVCVEQSRAEQSRAEQIRVVKEKLQRPSMRTKLMGAYYMCVRIY